MKITKTIPETIEDQFIRQITFDIETKKAFVQVDYTGETPHSEMIEVDFSNQLGLATALQKTVIKKFFKQVMAKAWDVLDTEIPDTVFDPND